MEEKNQAKSYRLDRKLKSHRDRYKPIDYKACDFNKKRIDVEKIYNPSWKMIDLSDSGVDNRYGKGGIFYSEQFNQEQLDFDINPHSNKTSNHATRSLVSDSNMIDRREKEDNSFNNLYNSADCDKEINRISERINDTGRLEKYQNPNLVVDRSNRSINYLEKARLRDRRKMRSPGLLYKKYHDTKEKIRSTGRLSQRHNDYEKINIDCNLVNVSSAEGNESKKQNILIHSSFDTNKNNEVSKSKRNKLQKLGPEKVVSGKIDFTNSEDNDKLKYESQGFESLEKYLSANENLKDYDSSVTKEEKYNYRLIKDRYSKGHNYSIEERAIINPYTQMVAPEGDEDDETLKYRQSIINMQENEPIQMDFTNRQNLTGLFKDLKSNLIDGSVQMKDDNSERIILSQNLDKVQKKSKIQDENAEDHALQDQNIQSLKDQEHLNEPKPLEEERPCTEDQVDLVDHEKSPAVTQDNLIIAFEEETKIITQSDSKGPVISDEFAKRQSSIHEEYVHGVASPNNKPKNIIDMVDNIDEQFDNIDDDFDEGTPERIKKHNFKLQHMQSDQVYLKSNEDVKI